MKRINKYVYLFVVQGKYPGPHGWEDLTQSEDWSEARQNLKDYRNNEPGRHRMIKRRELNPMRDLLNVVMFTRRPQHET